MKKNQLLDQATDPTRPNQEINLRDEEKNPLPDESVNLSTKRIGEGSAITTALLSQILADGQRFRHPSP